VSDRQAILLVVHRNPEQVRRLVERLRHPEVDVFLHVDARCDPAPFALSGATLLERRFPICWSGFGFVRTCLAWFETLEAQGSRHARFTLLSGQDYPLRPISEIVDGFRRLDGECIDVGWSGEDRRYRYEVFWVHPPELGFARGAVDRILRRFWYRHHHWRRLPRGLEFACGSAFCSLTRQGVAHILERVRREPRLVRFFENTFAPEEMFFQMLLWNSPLRERIVPDTHYIDWKLRLEHPKTLGREDLEAMLSSGRFFARKFEPDSPVLDDLDRIAEKA
jgi:hypothetical protein